MKSVKNWWLQTLLWEGLHVFKVVANSKFFQRIEFQYTPLPLKRLVLRNRIFQACTSWKANLLQETIPDVDNHTTQDNEDW